MNRSRLSQLLKIVVYNGSKHLVFLFYKVPFLQDKIIKFLKHSKELERQDLSQGLIGDMFSRLIMKVWVEMVYIAQPDQTKRQMLKESLLGKNADGLWAHYYLTKTPPIDEERESGKIDRFFSAIESVLDSEKDVSVFQIGSSSGREIAYLANKYPNISFYGTDISDEAIKISSKNHRTDNLRFEVCAATDIVKMIEKYPSKNILLFSSSALQYVHPNHLGQMFHSIRNYKNIAVIFNEGGTVENGLPDTIEGSLHWYEFLYSHNYKYYAEKNGFRTIQTRLVRGQSPIVS